MSFTLTTDTSCDAFKSELDAAGIPWVPLTFTIDGGEANEDNYSNNSQYQAFYDKLATGVKAATSQINTFTHEEFFEKVLANNDGKEVVHLTLSGGLSETVNSARVAASIVNERHGSTKIHIVDTLSATQGHRIILDHAVELQKEGKSATEATSALNAFAPKIQHWFMVDDLNHLKRGGRVSAASALIGGLLKIKPILTIDAIGKLQVVKKAKGSAAAINFFMDTIKESKEDLENGAFYVVNANAHKNVEALKERLAEAYPNCPIKGGWVGPVIGAHTGSGTFGLAFVGNKERIPAKLEK